MLAAAARLVEGRASGPLTGAADSLARAARERWGRTPPRSAVGVGLRTAGRLLSATQFAGRTDTRQLLALLAALAALADAVRRLREVQHRAAQAAAARRSATLIRSAADQQTGEQMHRLAARTAQARTHRRQPAPDQPATPRRSPTLPPPGRGRHR